MRNALSFVALWLLVSLVACSSKPPAPIVDRLPANNPVKLDPVKTQKNIAPTNPSYKAGDWRPDTYIVKKGDTLFSIGLEYGYDYQDIARTNHIGAPYHIQVGQILKLRLSKEKVIATETKPNQPNNTDGVEITPINTHVTSTSTAIGIAAASPQIIAITEPKAIRETYSEEALKPARPAAKPVVATIITKPTVITTSEPTDKPDVEIKPENKVDPKPGHESPADLNWVWPTKGKIIANFNETGNKGLDIAGNAGQAVNAAATGKVIYSGADLRGYGKLVIIKHNATYLSVYAHNSQILVKEGQQISSGQKIAEMGNTDSHLVKLHFEIRRQGKSVDPSQYLAPN